MTIMFAFEITIEDKEQQPIFLIHEFSKKDPSFSIKNIQKIFSINSFRKCRKLSIDPLFAAALIFPSLFKYLLISVCSNPIL